MLVCQSATVGRTQTNRFAQSIHPLQMMMRSLVASTHKNKVQSSFGHIQSSTFLLLTLLFFLYVFKKVIMTLYPGVPYPLHIIYMIKRFYLLKIRQESDSESTKTCTFLQLETEILDYASYST